MAGNVDICVSDFWQTTERSKIAAFTTGVDSDTMVLVTMPVGGAAALEEKPFSGKDITMKNIVGVFGPFTPEVNSAAQQSEKSLVWKRSGIGQGSSTCLVACVI